MNKINGISLDGMWKLFYEQNSNCKEYAYDISSVNELENSGIKSIDASVPGNFELDLQRAGKIPDPERTQRS